jgi:small subunit ribosomal protein S6e
MDTGTQTNIRQNEYAQIMHKRVHEEKAKKDELRKRRVSSMHKA